jgi:hypothetical protein
MILTIVIAVLVVVGAGLGAICIEERLWHDDVPLLLAHRQSAPPVGGTHGDAQPR